MLQCGNRQNPDANPFTTFISCFLDMHILTPPPHTPTHPHQPTSPHLYQPRRTHTHTHMSEPLSVTVSNVAPLHRLTPTFTFFQKNEIFHIFPSRPGNGPQRAHLIWLPAALWWKDLLFNTIVTPPTWIRHTKTNPSCVTPKPDRS